MKFIKIVSLLLIFNSCSSTSSIFRAPSSNTQKNCVALFDSFFPIDSAASKKNMGEIETDLFNGEAVEFRSFNENDNQTSLFKVKIYNPETKRYRWALFKPRNYGDNQGYGRSPMEYVFYKVNLFLGMDYVPPVAYRSKSSGRPMRLGSTVYDEGSLQLLVDDAHNLVDVPINKWFLSKLELSSEESELAKDLFLSDTRILDVLLQNPDRHKHNYLRGVHWNIDEYFPMLIDHAACLRKGTNTQLDQEDAFLNGPVKIIRKSTFEALKKFGHKDLSTLSEFISEQEINEILGYKNQILQYFEKLIKEKGLNEVVIP